MSHPAAAAVKPLEHTVDYGCRWVYGYGDGCETSVQADDDDCRNAKNRNSMYLYLLVVFFYQ